MGLLFPPRLPADSITPHCVDPDSKDIPSQCRLDWFNFSLKKKKIAAGIFNLHEAFISSTELALCGTQAQNNPASSETRIPYLEEKNEVLRRITDCSEARIWHSTGECICYLLPLCCLSRELVYRLGNSSDPLPAQERPLRGLTLLLVCHPLGKALGQRELYQGCAPSGHTRCSHTMEGKDPGNVDGLEEFGECDLSSVT